MTFLREISGIS